LILIFSVNTNHESVAYRSFSPSEFEARGARKVTTVVETFAYYYFVMADIVVYTPSSSQDSSLTYSPGYTVYTSSSQASTIEPDFVTPPASQLTAVEKKDQAWQILLARGNCVAIVEKLVHELPTVVFGWCRLTSRVTNKQDDKVKSLSRKLGYVQLSWDGINHAFLLHHLLAFLRYRRLPIRDGTLEVSHLCGNTVCTRPGHVVWEPAEVNQVRKNCLVWVACPHHSCPQEYIVVCPHKPMCIKAFGNLSEGEFRANPSVYAHLTEEQLGALAMEPGL